MKQPCALLLGVSLASLASAALLQSTGSDIDVPQWGDKLDLLNGAQGHGSVNGNYWNQAGSHWKGVRGRRSMCARDDPIRTYNFSVQITAGGHHQIGVANKECCRGVATSNSNANDKYACLYSHHTGWDRYRGSARPVGTPSKSTWFDGTWDGAGKTVLVSVSCEKKTFTVGVEGGDEFLGEMSWPDSWDAVYAFSGAHSHNMQVYLHWRGVETPPLPEGACPKFQVGNQSNPWWRCDDQAPDEVCNQSYTATQYGVYMRCAVLGDDQDGQRCGHTELCTTTTTTTTLHPSGPLMLEYFSQGHGTIHDNRWVQGGSSWKGVRGERRMCFDGDTVTTYKFKVRIDGGSHNQIGVASKDCCYGVGTSNSNTNDKYACLYSHHNGWDRYRGAARPVGTPSKSTWWTGVWDSGGKTMLVEVNCTKHTFTVGWEGTDDFLGEMTFPESWGGAYPFCGQQSSNMDATFDWNP